MEFDTLIKCQILKFIHHLKLQILCAIKRKRIYLFLKQSQNTVCTFVVL